MRSGQRSPEIGEPDQVLPDELARFNEVRAKEPGNRDPDAKAAPEKLGASMRSGQRSPEIV